MPVAPPPICQRALIYDTNYDSIENDPCLRSSVSRLKCSFAFLKLAFQNLMNVISIEFKPHLFSPAFPPKHKC